MLDRLETIPGVRSAALSAFTPTERGGAARFGDGGRLRGKTGGPPLLWQNWVGPRYFETLGTPLVAGRDFQFPDENGPRVAIVNRAMARYYLARAAVIGRHFTFEGQARDV